MVKLSNKIVHKEHFNSGTCIISTRNRFTPIESLDITESNSSLVDCTKTIQVNRSANKNWKKIYRTGLKKKINKGMTSTECKANSKIKQEGTEENKDSNDNTEHSRDLTFQCKNRLSCMYFNARSILNKIDELEIYIKEEDLDLVGITETWLTEEILTSEVNMEGFTLLRKDRKDLVKKRGGGVAIYVKNDIKIVERDDLNMPLFPESIWCELISKGDKTLLGVCYRPPDSSVENNEALYSLINKIGRSNVVIMGDFNYTELRWDNKSKISHEHPFINCLNENFLEQLVEKPTRGDNILDLVLCSEINIVQNLTIGEPFANSDHQIIRFNLIVAKEKTKDNTINYNYFKADYEKIRDYAKSRNWEKLVDKNDIEKSWLVLKSEIIQIRNEIVPKRKRNKNKCKWINKEVVACRRAKKKAWNKYIKYGKNVNIYQQYVSKRKQCATVNRKAKEEFETKLADNVKKDCKSFYAYIRSKQRSKETVGPLKDSSGNVITDDKVTADLLNKQFVSVFTKEDLSTIPEPENVFTSSSNQEKIKIHISEELVYKKLDELNVNKCVGVDDIHPKLLYELRYELQKPLCKLFKLSIETALIPQDWRDANVTPLFKKGSRNMAENYRPISLTSIIGKILESIIKDIIVEHLEKFKLIYDSQHGFRKGRSCLTNLLDFIEVVTHHLDEGQPVDLVYLDFAKAFDKVPFCRLFKKLEAHGIGEQVLQWIQKWLHGRRQRVSVNKTLSEWAEVTSGVPQGSVLGPVLFLVYINDIDLGVISKLSKFADDSKLCKNICTDADREALQQDLDRLNEWSQKWQMKFNVDKCSVIHIGHKNKQYNYKLGDTELKEAV